MELAAHVLAWLTDPAHWQGADGIPVRIVQHVEASGVSVLAAAVIALPIGLAVGHSGRGGFVIGSVANLGRALPSFALLLMLIPVAVNLRLDFSTWPILGAMVLLAIPPMITNAHAGMREVDRDLVEAARGMGMSGAQVLLRLELPLALPVILTGMRLAAVQVVATYTLGAVAGGGGLGRYIYDGFARQDTPRMLAGAGLVALLAIATDVAFEVVARITAPHGLGAGERPGGTESVGRLIQESGV
ncbi:MAG TPA: ABC transporter permease subunit [Candidatus Acidoferrales bacterium]|nr:ABC transporter permease subunit [Candidatus Acidoferrales bacterium]